MKRAAIVTVGSELTAGLRIDTNTAEIARSLAPKGYSVVEAVSVSDDVGVLSDVLERLCSAFELVVTTGGLGPTHDDITREAAAIALGLPLVFDDRIAGLLEPAIRRHRDPEAADQILVQAKVLAGARVIDFTSGTAPGLVVPTPGGVLLLLPGPPSEMRPMLLQFTDELPSTTAKPRELSVTGMSESDAQVAVSRVLASREGIGFTVLAKPGDVRILLSDEGCGAASLDAAVDAVGDALGAAVYSSTGESLAQVVVRVASGRQLTIATAESCTGGMVAAALTGVPGSSAVFRGGVVSYHNDVKVVALGVDEDLLRQHGAVSEECAAAMASGVRSRLGADIAVAVTGIAGPDGGSEGKPVGLVWFALDDGTQVTTLERLFLPTSREAIRDRATGVALDLLWRAAAGV